MNVVKINTVATQSKTTNKGYNKYALLSCLQKDIRRSNVREALFLAIKLEMMEYPMLWNRLEIIATEDIGIADPLMSVKIRALRSQYEDAVSRRSDSYRLFLASAIIQLSRSKKSRIVDDIVWDVYWEIENNDLRLPIPDYAIDHHVKGGDKTKWIDEGCKLVNEVDIENLYRDKAKKNVASGKTLGKKFPLKRGRKKKKGVPSSPSQNKTQLMIQEAIQ